MMPQPPDLCEMDSDIKYKTGRRQGRGDEKQPLTPKHFLPKVLKKVSGGCILLPWRDKQAGKQAGRQAGSSIRRQQWPWVTQ
jgi:hypothetical protein